MAHPRKTGLRCLVSLGAAVFLGLGSMVESAEALWGRRRCLPGASFF